MYLPLCFEQHVKDIQYSSQTTDEENCYTPDKVTEKTSMVTIINSTSCNMVLKLQTRKAWESKDKDFKKQKLQKRRYP